MRLKIEIPLGYIVRVLEDDGARFVACVLDPGSGSSCGACELSSSNGGSCPLACCAEERVDKNDVIFVEVAGRKGGEE